MKKISLIIPCYNEEKNINLFYDMFLKEKLKEYTYELIFVDDGSNDGTLKELKKLKELKNITIKILSFSRNFGKEAALYAGLKEAKGDYSAIIDADLQQRVFLVMNAVTFLEKNSEFDIVAYFQENRKEGFVLSGFKRTFYKIINKMSEVEFVQGASDFRIMRKQVIEAILEITEKNRFSKGIFSWVGFKSKFNYYTPEKRATGETKWSFKKLFKYALSGMVSSTTVPLRFSTCVGVVTSFGSFIYMAIVILQKLIYGIEIPGYATIVVLILFMGSIQLLSLGILGEYLSKTYIETKNRPIYILKERIEKNER